MPTYTTVNDVIFGSIRDVVVMKVETGDNFNPPGDTLTIPDKTSQDVIRLDKNGTSLSEGTDFTFSRPDKITLTSDSVDGDVYELERLIHLRTDEIVRYIERAESIVDAKLSKLYTVPFPSPVPGIIVTITELISSAFVLDALQARANYQPSDDNEQDLAEKWLDQANTLLKDLLEQEIELPGLDENREVQQAGMRVALDDSQNETTVSS